MSLAVCLLRYKIPSVLCVEWRSTSRNWKNEDRLLVQSVIVLSPEHGPMYSQCTNAESDRSGKSSSGCNTYLLSGAVSRSITIHSRFLSLRRCYSTQKTEDLLWVQDIMGSTHDASTSLFINEEGQEKIIE